MAAPGCRRLCEPVIKERDLQRAESGERGNQAGREPRHGLAPARRREEQRETDAEQCSRREDPRLSAERQAVGEAADERVLQAVERARTQQNQSKRGETDSHLVRVVARGVDVERQAGKGEHGRDGSGRKELAARVACRAGLSHRILRREVPSCASGCGRQDPARCQGTGRHRA